MIDMASTIIPKSDQLNADDLLAGPRTIKVTRVTANEGVEQPRSVHFEGDDNRPFKPCKSMRRVLVAVWGLDASLYAGRSMTLYCDPEVIFGGAKVGGIRISHMSHIDGPKTVVLTASKAKRKPFTVQPLKPAAEPEQKKEPEVTPQDKAAYLRLLTSAPNIAALQDTFRRAWTWGKDPLDEEAQKEFKALYDKRMKEFS